MRRTVGPAAGRGAGLGTVLVGLVASDVVGLCWAGLAAPKNHVAALAP